MPQLPKLEPIADAPVSVSLLLSTPQPRLEGLLGDWCTTLNGLNRDYDLVLVDDGTGQATDDLLARFPRLRATRHASPRGAGASLRAALAGARFPLVFYSECDPQYRPADLKKLLKAIDPVHLVSGYRAGRPVPTGARGLGNAWRLFSRIAFSFAPPRLPGWLGWIRHAIRPLVRIAFGVHYRDPACPFRLFRRELVGRLVIQSEGAFAHVELLAKANFLGCLLGEEVPIPAVPGPLPALSTVFRDVHRVLQRPDFGPPVLAPLGPPRAVVVPWSPQPHE